MNRWVGRVALVTGASAGIGAAIAKKLVQSGMKVVGAARGVEKIQALANELAGEKGSLIAVKCDLTKDEDIYNLFAVIKKEFGGVDICVNNAGMATNKSLLDGTPEEWRTMLDINVIALCLCTKLASESMKERAVDDGHIINISSMSGHRVVPSSIFHFYSATKFAVNSLCEGYRQEFREANSHIRVTSISPGLVETEFLYRVHGDHPEGAKASYSALHCLSAEDVADSVLHAISAPSHVEINDILMRPTEQKS